MVTEVLAIRVHLLSLFAGGRILGLDPGVHRGVQQVHHQHAQAEGDGQKDGAALDDGEVAVVDGGDDIGAHAGDGEDGLNDHHAAQQTAEGGAHHGDDGDQAVFQGMLDHHGGLGDTLGAGGDDVVGPDHVQHGRAGLPGAGAQAAHTAGKGGQDVAGNPAVHRPQRRQPAQLDGELDDQQHGQPEVGDGHADQGQQHTQVVLPPVLVGGGDDAQGDAQAKGDQHGDNGQQECAWEALKDGGHDLHVGGPGLAHVEAEKYVAQIGE